MMTYAILKFLDMWLWIPIIGEKWENEENV